jgi:1,4-dihydroxy-2-naphthoyl-CoA hydrolase
MIKSDITPELVNKMGQNTLVSHLGIVCTEVGPNFICGKMPVDHTTIQPHGLLHGGASVVLAETLGSYGSNFCVDQDKQFCVGLEINANHVKSARSGYVFGRAELIHFGKKTHIWDIRIRNEKGELVCISRLTIAVIDREK